LNDLPGRRKGADHGNPGRQASCVGEVSGKIRPALLEQRRCPGLERIFPPASGRRLFCSGIWAGRRYWQ
jgi:hypothetical protein